MLSLTSCTRASGGRNAPQRLELYPVQGPL